MNVTTVHTLWLVIPCLMLGAFMAWLLYRRGRNDVPTGLAKVLFVVRTLTIALIAFFLLEPMLQFNEREVRKPVVVIAHDGSSSLLLAGDTAALRGSYREALATLTKDLSDNYDVRSFTYGSAVTEGLNFGQQEAITDMSDLFRAIHDRVGGSELGAVILDGDGIHNRGRDPRLDAARLGVPVHTIALGDTTVRPDLVLKAVEHNRITYMGNTFPVLVRVQGHHLKGRRTEVTVSRDGVIEARREVSITSDPYLSELVLELNSKQPGPQRYVVRIVPVDGELTTANNEQAFVVDVLDDRQRVILLGAAPHPDLGAIRQALQGMEGYEVELAYATGPEVDLSGSDLLVLHGLPSIRQPLAAMLQRAALQGIPMLFIAGQGSDLVALDAARAGVSVSGGRPAVTDALPAMDRTFALFTLEDELIRAIERFPPLQVPFAQYAAGRSAQILLHQRIGMVRTAQPLMAFTQEGERRMGVITGEGLWRWRLADLRMNGDHTRFDKLLHRTVQFLALKVSKEPFRVDHAALFEANEPVLFTAELYNANLEAINTADVRLRITDSTDQELSYVFDRVGNAYRLDAGRLAAGAYRWSASAELDGRKLSRSGVFHVHEPMLERSTTVADHALLADLSATTGGRTLYPAQLNELTQVLKDQQGLVARSYVRSRYSDLISLRGLFFAILALLSLEWILRRRSGSY